MKGKNRSRPIPSRFQEMFGEEASEASVSFLKYYTHIAELAMSMFKWENLPPTCNERTLEKALFRNGHALFFIDEAVGPLALRCALAGPFDINDIPMTRTAYANNGYQNTLGPDDSVVIYNNYLRTNSMLSIRHYATRLADLENAIDVNCKAQKTPVMILCNENERLSLQNLYAQFEGNFPFIFGEKGLDLNAIKAINTQAPFVADRMYQIKMQIWNECLTELGISNISYQKKERLVSDEVIRNMGGTIASRYSRLEMRKLACDEINRMFGDRLEKPISVSYRDDLGDALRDSDGRGADDEQEGGDADGQVYD